MNDQDRTPAYFEVMYEEGTGGLIRMERGYIAPGTDEISLLYTLVRPEPGMAPPARTELYRKFIVKITELPTPGGS